MNSSQIQSLTTTIGAIVAAILTVLVALGKITPDQSSDLLKTILGVVGGVVTLGITVYKLIPHTDANTVLAASTVPGTKVNVDVSADSAATPAVKAIANDNSNAVVAKAA